MQYWHKTQVDQTSSSELISSYHNNNDKNKDLQQGNQQESHSTTRSQAIKITRTPTRTLYSSSSSQISKQVVQAYKSLNKLTNNNNNNYK